MATPQLKFKITLASDLNGLLSTAVEDELTIASHKWQCVLNDEQRELIRRHAFAQLRLRVAAVVNEPWDLTNDIVVAVAGPAAEVRIPIQNEEYENVQLIRGRDGFRVSVEGEESIALNDLPQVLLNEIVNWLRTAVFYSVGSLTP